MTAHFVWLAITAGAVSLLTPCVFPMIPLTVTYFASQGTMHRRDAVGSALLFGLAIVASFTALGLALSLVVGATGAARFATNPIVNLALAALFVAFALNLFGVFEIVIPGRALTALDAAARQREAAGARIAGALLMGVTFSLTSFTCTAPFIGTVLVTAATGAWKQPAIGMLAYATVFALPFFLLALVPHWALRLPRGGKWLVSVKVLMGLVELAAAFKFLSNADLVWHWGIFSRDVVLASWIVLAGSGVVYLLATGSGSFGRLVTTAVAGGVGVWLCTGLAGRPLGGLEAFLPPMAKSARFLNWQMNNLPAALAAAQTSSKPVFIDFTGYTCTNCRWMEANIFSRPDVEATLSKFELARLFTDGDGPIYVKQQAYQESRFNTVALPLYVVMSSDGRTLGTYAGLVRDPAVFVAFLEKSIQAQ